MSFFSHDVIALNAFYGVRYPLTVNAQYGLMPTVTQNINNSIAVSIPQQERYPIRLKPIGSRVISYEHFGTTELGPLIKNSRGWLQPEKIVPSSAGFQHLGQAADFGFSRYQVGMEFKNKNGTIGAIWVDYLERTCRLVGSGVVFQQCFQGENDAQFYFLSDAEIIAYRVNATFHFSVKDANKLSTLTSLGHEIGSHAAPRGGIIFIPTYSRFWVPEEYGKVYVHSVYTAMDINLTGRGCMATILPANIDFGDVSAHDFGAKKGEPSH